MSAAMMLADAERIREAITNLGIPSTNFVIKGLNMLIARSIDSEKENIQIDNFPVNRYHAVTTITLE